MNDLDGLTALDDLLVESAGENLVDDGFMIAGAIVIGLYVGPDGESTATWHRALGSMNAFTQEGVLRSRLRDLEAAEADPDD